MENTGSSAGDIFYGICITIIIAYLIWLFIQVHVLRWIYKINIIVDRLDKIAHDVNNVDEHLKILISGGGPPPLPEKIPATTANEYVPMFKKPESKTSEPDPYRPKPPAELVRCSHCGGSKYTGGKCPACGAE